MIYRTMLKLYKNLRIYADHMSVRICTVILHSTIIFHKLSYISICTCTCTCTCAYRYHIKTGLKMWSVSIHMYVCVSSSIWITTGSDSDGWRICLLHGLGYGKTQLMTCTFYKTYYARHNTQRTMDKWQHSRMVINWTNYINFSQLLS